MFRLIALLIVFCSPALAEDHLFPRLYNVRDVASDDTLNIRSQPASSGEIVGELAWNATNVEVLGASPNGKWGLVNTGEGMAGWAFLRYLEPVSGAHWTRMATPLDCGGTEPFWDVDLITDAPSVFTMLGAPVFTLEPDWASGVMADGSGAPSFVLMRHQSANGASTAFVRAETCSDGMSDRVYGLAIDLFLDRFDEFGNARYRGCCTLGIGD